MARVCQVLPIHNSGNFVAELAQFQQVLVPEDLRRIQAALGERVTNCCWLISALTAVRVAAQATPKFKLPRCFVDQIVTLCGNLKQRVSNAADVRDLPDLLKFIAALLKCSFLVYNSHRFSAYLDHDDLRPRFVLCFSGRDDGKSDIDGHWFLALSTVGKGFQLRGCIKQVYIDRTFFNPNDVVFSRMAELLPLAFA